MTVERREAFIPYSRQALIDICLNDSQLDTKEHEKFRDFCQILAAYYHFKFHHYLEIIKRNYAFFNPDLDLTLANYISDESATITAELLEALTTILEKANYYPLSSTTLRRAFSKNYLLDLKTEVDFNDFEQMLCYCRGDNSKTITVKRFFRKKEIKLDIFDQVVLLIKFKTEQHFKDKPVREEELSFKPGKIYVYLYKKLSKLDLEFIFPNVKMSMNWKDRLLFGIPAVGAGISLIVKIIPRLLLIIGLIFYVFFGYVPDEKLQVKEEEVREITPVLVTMFSLIMTLGGFAFKQYNSYKSKQIKFQKNVTETLFFRNMANNAGVFQYLIDAAEEEECKEIILVYYHLLTSQTPLTLNQLDNRIEVWMEEKLGKKIDFDIKKTIRDLESIRGKINRKEKSQNVVEVPLLRRDRDNYCRVLSLDEAKQVIDYVWDNTFKYF